MATKKLKDLSPKKNPKGSRLIANDNLTLLRAAKKGRRDPAMEAVARLLK